MAALTDAELADVYRDLHLNPELSFQEQRTAAIAAEHLTEAGFEVTTGIGGTGVVGILRRGAGATVLLRADMDALPVAEETGLPYASTRTATAANGDTVPVMHACGHDVHTTCLIGAVRALAADDSWSGTLIAVFQPAEELGAGAGAMVKDGLFDIVPKPDVVLGQHVAPAPAGFLGVQDGASFAAPDAILITLFGAGGHGSRPETTIDPVLMAAALTLRLQGIVSREVAGTEMAVLSVVSINSGGATFNVIPDTAQLRLTLRTYDRGVRDRIVAAIERITKAEAMASGATKEPTVEYVESFPAAVNDHAAAAQVREAFARDLPEVIQAQPGSVTGSEDVSVLAEAAGAPLAFWILGGADPALFKSATSIAELQRIVGELPSNHSPFFAPVITPTLQIGVAALLSAAKAWLKA
ncbi:amidohydrolase [Branchiibius cervicis]|uniref:Amidohydrolase n=1 Tax=Branchiibius cervicis TaxID=908252 RepID=A0ABW2AN24_9MICO